MGRKALRPDEAGVTIRLPRVLLDQIDRFAKEEFHLSRPDAIRDLLWRGLRLTAALDRRETTMREIEKAARDAWAGRA